MTPDQPLRGVVFDLFHTLVDTEHLRPLGFDSIVEVARLTGLDHPALRRYWDDTYVERESTPVDLVDMLRRHVAMVGAELRPDHAEEVDRLFGICKDDALLHPSQDAVDLLTMLRSHCSVGVLSNCHEREARCWPRSPLAPLVDVMVRSCDIGVMKPELAAYEVVITRLGIDAADLAYVGNGGSDELDGAQAAGFGVVVHSNVFDRNGGVVSIEEQRRRAAQADISVDNFADLDAALRMLLGGWRSSVEDGA